MEIKNIILNKNTKTTTLVVKEELKDIDILEYLLNGKQLPKTNKAIQVKCANEDEYDPYVGVALALAEAAFGSKRQFRMWVDKKSQIASSKEEKKKEREERVAKAVAKKKGTESKKKSKEVKD